MGPLKALAFPTHKAERVKQFEWFVYQDCKVFAYKSLNTKTLQLETVGGTTTNLVT